MADNAVKPKSKKKTTKKEISQCDIFRFEVPKFHQRRCGKYVEFDFKKETVTTYWGDEEPEEIECIYFSDITDIYVETRRGYISNIRFCVFGRLLLHSIALDHNLDHEIQPPLERMVKACSLSSWKEYKEFKELDEISKLGYVIPSQYRALRARKMWGQQPSMTPREAVAKYGDIFHKYSMTDYFPEFEEFVVFAPDYFRLIFSKNSVERGFEKEKEKIYLISDIIGMTFEKKIGDYNYVSISLGIVNDKSCFTESCIFRFDYDETSDCEVSYEQAIAIYRWLVENSSMSETEKKEMLENPPAEKITARAVSEYSYTSGSTYISGSSFKPEFSSGQKDASVIGRAVAGAVIAGPAGAVVGALSAVDKNNKNRK